jgi:hypothetical protein
MGKSDNDFFNDRLKLFEQEGWSDLVGELETLSLNLNDVRSIENEKDLYFVKGQLSMIQMIINLEDSTKQLLNEPE